MKLIDALKLVNDRAKDLGSAHRLSLACGFTPLHLKTFFAAQLVKRTDAGAVLVDVGLFGDLLGTLRRLAEPVAEGPTAVAILLEWSDLDPRLGWRTTHGWRPDKLNDIADSAARRLDEFTAAIESLAQHRSVAVSLPTIPLPPLFRGPTTSVDPVAASLRARLQHFAASLAALPRVRVLDEQWLSDRSPAHARHDPQADLRSGFPYRIEHAVVLAEGLADLLKPAAAKKGIITDLDNTFWRGIVGEDGVANVAWDIDHRALGHGLYQELLASLADAGVLLAVASKNDRRVVAAAFERSDLVLTAQQLFPIEAHWGPKSQSVSRILQAWNIHQDSVVFIDDSPAELAEVASVFPQITGLQFPSGDEAGIVRLLQQLRSLCGKSVVTDEDRIRLSSLRASHTVATSTSDPDDFLSQAEAVVSLQWNQPDARTLELINKTNQFNLNGRRWDESDWHARLADPQTFVLSVSYSDKYAPLGKIAVVVGRQTDSGVLLIDAWVLSCRAFSRRIEHATVRALFEHFECDALQFDFAPTDRNGPLQETLQQLVGQSPSSPVTLLKSQFVITSPQLFAQVETHEQPLAISA